MRHPTRGPYRRASAPGGHLVQRPEDVLQPSSLRDESGGAGPAGRSLDALVRVGGEDHDRELWSRRNGSAASPRSRRCPASRDPSGRRRAGAPWRRRRRPRRPRPRRRPRYRRRAAGRMRAPSGTRGGHRRRARALSRSLLSRTSVVHQLVSGSPAGPGPPNASSVPEGLPCGDTRSVATMLTAGARDANGRPGGPSGPKGLCLVSPLPNIVRDSSSGSVLPKTETRVGSGRQTRSRSGRSGCWAACWRIGGAGYTACREALPPEGAAPHAPRG